MRTETPSIEVPAPRLDAPRPASTPTSPAPSRIPSHRSPAFAFFCAYALFVVYATLLPFQFTTDPDALRAKREWINWNPMVLQTGEPTPIADVVINILFFVPLGFIGVHAQRRRSPSVLIARGALAGAALSLGVETLQFFTPSRNPATSDVLTNGAGAALGALLAMWVRVHVQGAVLRRATAWMIREPLLVLLVGDALLVGLAALVPFDFLITVSGLRRGLRIAQFDPRRGGSLDVLGEIPAALQYAVFAALLWFVVSRLVAKAPVVRAVICGTIVATMAIGLETVQLILRSHAFATRDILAAFAGALTGTVVAAFSVRRSQLGWTLALVAVIGVVTIQALAPFRFDFDPASMRQRIGWTTLVPYSSYYYKANVAAVADLLDGLFAYVPIAFLWARWRAGQPPRRVSHVKVALLCAAIALGLELLQLGVPRRYPEISDVLTAGLGGLLGSSAWRWYVALRDGDPALTAPASS